jgi:hypothetical protein
MNSSNIVQKRLSRFKARLGLNYHFLGLFHSEQIGRFK